MSGTDCQDKQQSQQPWISDPRLGLGLVPGGSKIEIKWRIQAENGDEMDLWWNAEVLSIGDDGVVDLLYEAMPHLGFTKAERARVKFVNRFYLEHDPCESEENVDHQCVSPPIPWRFAGEARDIDADCIDDTSEPAADVIRKELSEELKNRDPGEQRILASKIHSALEAFKDEILREALDHNNEINDRNAQNILQRVHQRLLGDQQ